MNAFSPAAGGARVRISRTDRSAVAEEGRLPAAFLSGHDGDRVRIAG